MYQITETPDVKSACGARIERRPRRLYALTTVRLSNYMMNARQKKPHRLQAQLEDDAHKDAALSYSSFPPFPPLRKTRFNFNPKFETSSCVRSQMTSRTY